MADDVITTITVDEPMLRAAIDEALERSAYALTSCLSNRQILALAVGHARQRVALRHAAEIFDEYAARHGAKDTDDGRAKAATNRRYAEEMRAVLGEATAAEGR